MEKSWNIVFEFLLEPCLRCLNKNYLIASLLQMMQTIRKVASLFFKISSPFDSSKGRNSKRTDNSYQYSIYCVLTDRQRNFFIDRDS